MQLCSLLCQAPLHTNALIPAIRPGHCSCPRTVVCGAKTLKRRGQQPEGGDDRAHSSRRDIILSAVNLALFGSAAKASTGELDGETVINSILGAYGLPQLKGRQGYKLFTDEDGTYFFEYPRSWVGRENSLRSGLVFSDFNTADKAALEVFQPTDRTLVEDVISRAINPAQQAGGDARLELPPSNRIRTEKKDINGQVYTYISFPSETITRSGYQVRRKNLAVATMKGNRVYSLVASSRTDQYSKEKGEMLQRIVESFRVRDL